MAEPARLRERLAPLRRPAIVVGLAGISVVVLANMAIMSYLGPYARDAAGIGSTGLGVFFMLAGAAGVAGGQISGMIAAGRGSAASLCLGTGLFMATMVALTVVWQTRPVHALAIAVLVVVWNIAAWAIPPAAQAGLFAHAGPAAEPAMALASSAAYLGVTAERGPGRPVAGHLRRWHPPRRRGGLRNALIVFWLSDRLAQPHGAGP